MMKQYGFYIDSSKCTGCKTCQLACKDFKDLGVDRSYRRVYEYAGGNWVEENGTYRQDVFAYYTSIACNHCDEQRVPKCVHLVRCINAKMVSLSLTKRCVLVVSTAQMRVRMARHNTAKKKVT
ncbi:anaerobic dimethyl sulfoxide reductase chain B [Vibrio astriarenae]|nr:anaerobic dimethyl sulfoxide reductase chain B [Vibrio sp. C7]